MGENRIQQNEMSRRSFIVGAAAGTAGLAAAGLFSGCSAQPNTSTDNAEKTNSPTIPEEFTDGVYLTKAISMHGPINVKTVIADGAISEVTVLNNRESYVIGEAAINSMPQRILDSQCIDVDCVTGATLTSMAIQNAVSEAITLAGGDPGNFKGYQSPEPKEADVERECDVAIMGAGMAGLMAAWKLAENGKSVMVFEKMPYVGGCMPITSTAWNAQDTIIQKAWGTEQIFEAWSSVEAQLQSYREGRIEPDNPYYNPDMPFITPMFDAARDATDMMINIGVGFCPISDWPAPQLAPGAFSIGGKFCLDIVKNYLTYQLGVEIITEAPVTELVTNEGAVTGLVAKGADGTVYHIASKAVMLASGGYISNNELMEQYQPDELKFPLMGPPWATGDGLLLGQEAGAALETMDQGVTSHYSGAVSHAEISYIHYVCPGVVVNGSGARFVSENMEYKQALRVFKDQPTTDFYWVFDEVSRQGMVPSGNSYRLDYTFLLETGDATEAGNYQELAEKLNLPDLTATLDAVNECARNGAVDEFGNEKLRAMLLDGNMYAIKVTPTPYIAQGGLKVDPACHVQKEDGTPIAGLYAAGDVVGSVENRDGAMYRIGLTQAIAYGLIAGETMSAEL
ncbi:FAD-binding protein [Raoultibacter phocaeensis]|uniref:FAD-binding protein n=1 Tax=Raoultibacter phocaeensis TaxID=2479841 RepID=UPI0015D62B76|nr:FAD-binding protein [Raoultibacter phocaeensis]